MAIAVVMTSTFAAAYTVALGRPAPREPAHRRRRAGRGHCAHRGRNAAGRHEFNVRTYPSREAAIAAVDRQTITAVIDGTAAPPQLLLSSASSSSAARVLTQLDEPAPGRYLLPITDLHPLPPSDPSGLATFYVTIAATILGFVTMFQLRANVKTLTLRGWLICVGALSVIGGAALTVVAGPVLGALNTRFPEVVADLDADCRCGAVQFDHAGVDPSVGDHPDLGRVHSAGQHVVGGARFRRHSCRSRSRSSTTPCRAAPRSPPSTRRPTFRMISAHYRSSFWRRSFRSRWSPW
ncbi:hypothetical protein [Mycobacterium sp. HNNTM2301]|uniref:hypothetical protein n=1 Tax=Mycobacterium hainanense TaxID=3289775 RepID=UPI0035A66A1A